MFALSFYKTELGYIVSTTQFLPSETNTLNFPDEGFISILFYNKGLIRCCSVFNYGINQTCNYVFSCRNEEEKRRCWLWQFVLGRGTRRDIVTHLHRRTSLGHSLDTYTHTLIYNMYITYKTISYIYTTISLIRNTRLILARTQRAVKLCTEVTTSQFGTF